jgi:hypothetical protein
MFGRQRQMPPCDAPTCHVHVEHYGTRLTEAQWRHASQLTRTLFRQGGQPWRYRTPRNVLVPSADADSEYSPEALLFLPGAVPNDLGDYVLPARTLYSQRTAEVIRPQVRALRVCTHDRGHVRATVMVRSRRAALMTADAVLRDASHDALFGTASNFAMIRDQDLTVFNLYLGATQTQRDLWAAFTPGRSAQRPPTVLDVLDDLRSVGMWDAGTDVRRALATLGPDLAPAHADRSKRAALADLLESVQAATC